MISSTTTNRTGKRETNTKSVKFTYANSYYIRPGLISKPDSPDDDNRLVSEVPVPFLTTPPPFLPSEIVCVLTLLFVDKPETIEVRFVCPEFVSSSSPSSSTASPSCTIVSFELARSRIYEAKKVAIHKKSQEYSRTFTAVSDIVSLFRKQKIPIALKITATEQTLSTLSTKGSCKDIRRAVVTLLFLKDISRPKVINPQHNIIGREVPWRMPHCFDTKSVSKVAPGSICRDLSIGVLKEASATHANNSFTKKMTVGARVYKEEISCTSFCLRQAGVVDAIINSRFLTKTENKTPLITL